MATDILVKTSNPAALDRTMNFFGAAVVGGGMPGGYVKIESCFVVRCFGDAGFIKSTIETQGYGEFVRELEELV